MKKIGQRRPKPRPRRRPHRPDSRAFGFGNEPAKCGTCSPPAGLEAGLSLLSLLGTLLGRGAERFATASPRSVNWIEIVMAETTEKTTEKKLSVAATKTLSLKGRGMEQGVVRQSFSHGRSKAVVVEKVKSRTTTARPKADAAPA